MIRNRWLILPVLIGLSNEFAEGIQGNLVFLVLILTISTDKRVRSTFDMLARAEVVQKRQMPS